MDDDEALAFMNLSLIAASKIDYYKNIDIDHKLWTIHEEIEELLEVYLADYNAMISKMNYLVEKINSSEALVRRCKFHSHMNFTYLYYQISLKLDTSENQILIAQWSATAFNCCVAFAGYIANVFGMNLDQTAGIPFVGMSSFLTLTSCLLSA